MTSPSDYRSHAVEPATAFRIVTQDARDGVVSTGEQVVNLLHSSELVLEAMQPSQDMQYQSALVSARPSCRFTPLDECYLQVCNAELAFPAVTDQGLVHP